MDSDLFANSRQRLERARQHLLELDKEWNELFEDETFAPSISADEHLRVWTVKFVPTPKFLEKLARNKMALLLGEIAYQLRAALDGLIWDAVTYTQQAEPRDDAKGLHKLEFPLSPEWKATDMDQNRFHGFPFPQNLIDPDRGMQNTLEDIHDLARKDRHRRLRLTSIIPADGAVEITTTPPGGGMTWHEWTDFDLFTGKYDYLRFRAECPGGLTPYKVSLNTKAGFHVLFEGVEMYDGAHVGVQINRFIEAVGRVIDRFAAEFR